MKSEELSIVKRLFYYMTLLVAVLLTACSSDETIDTEQPLPEGMGCIRLTICTPENAGGSTTRAVNATPWEDPDHEWEKLQTFRIFICKKSNNEVVQIISGDKSQLTDATTLPSTYKSATVTSQPLEAGSYYVYATANYADGYSVGDTFDPNETVKFANGYSATSADYFGDQKDIPMTGKLTTTPGGNNLREVGVANGIPTDVTDTPLTLWRVMGKMQFYFTNESKEKIRIKGIEVDPLNLASSSGPGIYLFSKDVLTSTANLAAGATPPTGQEGLTLPPAPSGENMKSAREDVGAFRYEPATALELDATNGTGTLFFYVNESDGTFTVTENQLSLRFKIQRQNPTTSEWYDDELRYGVTTQHDLINSGDYGGYNGGFNVIRRNDWIHIPVVLTDWQFRIEPLAFVPIAGYPAMLLSNDALTATFSTGGYIILQPFVKKYSDATWRDFSNPDVTFVSVTWKNSDGTNESGNGKIVKTAFTYDSVNHCLVGELNNNLSGSHKTTLTVNVKLGPTGSQYDYSFTFNVILQK